MFTWILFLVLLLSNEDVNSSDVTKEESTMEKKEEMRSIKEVHHPEFSKIEDLITYRVFPTHTVDMEDLEPFIFLNHHGPQIYPPNNNGLPFGPHPHKGFETVTFIVKGDILHKDTKGHESVINEGGIQWMTAGSGVIHSEVSSEEFKAKGGDLEILQLWINLPAKLKNTSPNYIGLQKSAIPQISEDSGRVTVNLISGDWNNQIAPIKSISDVYMSSLNFLKGGKLNIQVDTSRRIFLYVVNGELIINKTQVTTRSLVEFDNNGSEVEIEALGNSLVLFGHALPNKEPIAARGPFVMNTMDEIRQAYKDYSDGKFGLMEE